MRIKNILLITSLLCFAVDANLWSSEIEGEIFNVQSFMKYHFPIDTIMGAAWRPMKANEAS